ncbi:MAG: ABC transporter permease [Alphaproteobacteria bacterium]|nr:ABC transporter permease [Alphaproteobacteria bacterium]HCP00712.1 ABC transporter permease [Rhodospirillaceae bacterium]
MSFLRPIIVLGGLLAIWQTAVSAFEIAPFILPGPLSVISVAFERTDIIARHALVTLSEILLGLLFGTLFGSASALVMAYFRGARAWVLPVLVVSQAVPVFALAPVLVLWFGYGMAPKVAMATLIIYFPVTAAFYDGLRRTEVGWIDLARTMGASKAAILYHIRLPAALPAFSSGLRVAAAVAPIGAVVGEWVGSSAGLGYYMLLMNGRVQTAAMFAALFVLALMAVAIYFVIDRILRRLIDWQNELDPAVHD